MGILDRGTPEAVGRGTPEEVGLPWAPLAVVDKVGMGLLGQGPDMVEGSLGSSGAWQCTSPLHEAAAR